MSLYHEAAQILTGSGSPNAHAGGSLKSRVFGSKDLKSTPAQVYALALESCKWSAVLKEVIENSQLLQAERKLTPALSILLVHDYLLNKGIALPATHGLRAAVERHKARLTSEFTRARLRRKCATVPDLRAQIENEYRISSGITLHPRWIRVNTIKSSVDEQLEGTFKGWEVLGSVAELVASASGTESHKMIVLDGHVPNLIAVSPSSGVDFTKTEAYREGKIILQDKASCFPAYLLDPRGEGDVVDACAAPGNKTTHLAAILGERERGDGRERKVIAFEKDRFRAKTLEKMVGVAGSDGVTVVNAGVDFLKVDPGEERYKNVWGLLLDPSCSGSGIVGRDVVPELLLPALAGGGKGEGDKKRKRGVEGEDGKGKGKKKKVAGAVEVAPQTPMEMINDDGEVETPESEGDLKSRIEALSTFQLSLLLHAFTFPSAKRVTYSTCSIYAGENEHVVVKALQSDVARRRGWRVLKREDQVRGMREWDVRGSVEACEGVGGVEADVIAEACVRAYNRDDGRGVMGFFVAGFVRDGDVDLAEGVKAKDDGPFVRDANGIIVRDENGIPTLKSTGKKAVDVDEMEDEGGEEVYVGEGGGGEGPFVRDDEGRIVRDAMGMPTLKEGSVMLSAKEKAKREKESKRKAKNKKNKKGRKNEGGGGAEGGDESGDDEWDGFD